MCITCLVLKGDGKVFTFGDNSYGQLGHSPTAEKRGPRLVERIEGLVSQIDCGSYHTLAYVYTTGQVVSFGRGPSCPGSSLHPEALAEDFDISCLISADGMSDPTNLCFCKDPSSNGVPRKTLPEISRIHQSLTEEWMAVAKGSAQFEAAKRNIPFHLLILFFISCIQRECGETNSIYVDLQMARDTFEKLTKKDWISFLITTSLKDNLLPALPHRSRHQEALSVFLLLPECPVMHDAKNWMALVVPFAEAVRKMTSQSLQVLKQCWESLQESSFNALVQMLKTAIFSQLYYWTETIQSHNNLKALLKMMKEVYKVRAQPKECIYHFIKSGSL
uniref:E3 ubiquitin-protein ligase HERC6 n=1 Tax=Sus scrofa TaxID=9823 RepID=A0A8D0PJB9_PIG